MVYLATGSLDFYSDPQLHDRQPSSSSASLLCILVLYGELIP